MICKKIKNYNENFLKDRNWHINLLSQANKTTKIRNKILSDEMNIKLIEYLKFRHTFKHIYGFQMKWEKMKHLALQLEETANEFINEINIFINNQLKSTK